MSHKGQMIHKVMLTTGVVLLLGSLLGLFWLNYKLRQIQRAVCIARSSRSGSASLFLVNGEKPEAYGFG